jgi:PAS domain S-box-containing protein
MKPLDFEQYRLLVEHAPMMMWRTGLDGKCDYFNATWLAYTGRTCEQELGDGWTEGVHPDDLEGFVAIYIDRFQQRRAFGRELRLRRRDGVYRHVFCRVVPYEDATGSFAGVIGSCVEIDDHQNRDAGSGDDQFFEMSLDHLCVAGLDGYFKRLNSSWCKTLGWTQEELMARPSIDLVHPDDREATLRARAGLGAGVPLHALVNRYQCKDQTYRWFEWRSTSHVDQGLVYAVARDVTEQKEVQRDLRELTESLATILNSLAEGVIAVDADGAVVRMNPVAEKLTGWVSSDAHGKPLNQVFDAVTADNRLPVLLPVARTLREGVATAFLNHTLLIGRDGTELPIASSCAPMKNADGSVRGAVLVFRDMRAEASAKEVQKQLQRQLIFADRMASVGTLAAGAAHEINNPLAYAMANLDMLIEEIRTSGGRALPARMTEWMEMALEARQGAERIRKIVRGLKTFSRGEEERRTIIEVRPVLELSISMAFNEIRHRARLVKDYGQTPLVEADDARLGQVFINLLVNAAQALPEGDTEANEIRIATSTDASGHAVIEVRDTGPGIPASVIGRVFDPFFTTKPIGIGTGLGLSICHNIVTSMGGEITVRSQEGEGAVFRVVLPPAQGGRVVVQPPAPVTTDDEGPAHRASILIVDDERALGEAIRHMLRDHEVTVVTTAKEALELLISERPFDLVLSDLMMPEMSGMDLYEELRRRGSRAATRMVFMTGGAFTTAAQKFLDGVPNERLEKPFGVTTLRHLIRKLMSSARHANEEEPEPAGQGPGQDRS